MRLSITYQEISNIIKKKTGRDIAISFKEQNIITATYKISVNVPLFKKPVSKDVSVNVQVLEFKDNQLIIRIDAGCAGNFAISAIQDYLVKFIPIGIYQEATDGRTFVVDLCRIKQLKPVLEQLDINSLDILPKEIRIDGTIKDKD